MSRHDPSADVRTALNAAEAKALCQKHDFDVIFTDVVMPEMDGFEFSAWVRETMGKKPTIIACTANSDKSLEDCEDVGIDYLVYKPFQFPDIKEILNHV